LINGCKLYATKLHNIFLCAIYYIATELRNNYCHYGMLIRSTKLRRAIMDILVLHDQPLAVPDLQRLLKERGMKPHKTSLYRSLEKMSSEGSVQEVLLDASGLYYELQRTHHHHALCNSCRAVMCIANDTLEKSMTHLEQTVKRKGFVSIEHNVVLKGVCARCRAQ
jgi:Fur family ferric uptake transcriptional regulator